MIAALLSLFSSTFGTTLLGSLTGGLMQWLVRRQERQELAEKNRHDEAMLTLQNAQAIALADKGMQAAQVAGDVAVSTEEARAFTASQQINVDAGKSPVLAILLSAVRAVITIYFVVAASIVTLKVGALVGGLQALDVATLVELYVFAIHQIFALTGICAGWWFAARGTSRIKSKGHAS